MEDDKQFWKRFLEKSFGRSIIGLIVTLIISVIVIHFVLHNDEMSILFREYFLSFIISIIIASFVFMTHKITNLIKLLNDKKNLINRIDEYVDNRIRDFYRKTLKNFKGKEYEHFTDFILEITDERVFKSSLPTLAEIENSDYSEIIKKAINYSSEKSFNSTLTGEYLPDWFFNSNGGMGKGEKLFYLKEMNELDSTSKRLMIFGESKLEESFKKLDKKQKNKFLNFHEKVKLFFIDKEDLKAEAGVNIDVKKIPDCVLFDKSFGLQKRGSVLKIIVGDEIKPINTIFNKLDDAIKNGRINNDNPFKDKDYIKMKFKAKDE